MPARRTHYEILGLARTATPEEIKGQFRKLAKRYHPDVAATTDTAAAHAAFVRISAAYEILSDPDKREAYDRDLRLAEVQRAATPPPSSTASRPAGPPPPRRPQARPRPDMQLALRSARVLASHYRFAEAMAACEEIVRQDPRNGDAYSLMGDIFRTQNQIDDAIRMYTMAVQLNPNSRSDMDKLNALIGRERSRTKLHNVVLPKAVRLAAGLGWIAVVLLVVLPGLYHGSELGWFPVTRWTDNLLIGMVVAGLLAGFLSTMTGFINRLDEEFLFSRVSSGAGPLPVGLLVGVASLVCFPLALAFYGIISLMAEAGSRSMVRVLGLTAAGTAAFAVTLPAAATQTLLLGGNVLFPCLVIGSFAGGFFREPWQ